MKIISFALVLVTFGVVSGARNGFLLERISRSMELLQGGAGELGNDKHFVGIKGVPTITYCNTSSTPMIINRFVKAYVYVTYNKNSSNLRRFLFFFVLCSNCIANCCVVLQFHQMISSLMKQ